MCRTVQNSVFEVEEIVTSLELSLLMLDETGCINKSSYALGFQKQDVPTRHYRVPVDLCEDG
jgi:hypothetical protein